MTTKQIHKFLIEKGVKPNLKGFVYLTDAIENDFADGSLIKNVYPFLADRYNTSSASIERAISTAIKTSSETVYLTNNEFICYAKMVIEKGE